MGHHRLAPTIGLGRLIGLTFALIAPASSVFLTYATGYHTAGTGIVLGYAVGGAVNLLVMLAYAEVGSQYPEAGGDYSLAARALGRRAASVYAVLFFVKGLAIPALLALSTATYAHQLYPPLPLMPSAFLVLLALVILASLDIRTSSSVVTAMVVVEFLVFAVFLCTAVTHLHQPLQVLIHPLSPRGPVGPKKWLGASVAALYGLNGPQASLYYSEEVTTNPRRLGRTILVSALVTIAVEMSLVVVVTLALPNLTIAPGTLPLTALLSRNLPWTWAWRLILFGITVALFDTGLSTLMSYSRIFYAIARDHQWPRLINGWAGHVNARGVPIGSLTLIGGLNLVVLGLSGVDLLVMLGGSLIIVIYGGVVIASLAGRMRHPPAPYRMPYWPWPPVIALAGLVFLARHLTPSTLIITGLVVLLGCAWAWVAPESG